MLPSRHGLAQLAVITSVLAGLSACSSSRTMGALDAGGGDAASIDSGGFDAGRDAGRDGDVVDAGPRGSCDPQDAREATCPAALCDGPDSWHWNGDRCFWITCGGCEGTECGARFSSEAECESAHASCEPSVCRASGGDWLFWAEECDHYVCGRPVPSTCVLGRPVCDCGALRVFDPALGCVLDVACTMEPPMPSREILCTGTGGGWEGICCDTVCGAFCPLACASPACNCGPGHVFDDTRGCIESTRCFERTVGETCDPRARCAAGTICCQSCGGAGCSGDPTCRAPTCDADPTIDECGNNLLAP